MKDQRKGMAMGKLVFAVLFAMGSLAYAGTNTIDKKNILTWPRAKVDQFGCFLEKSYGFKDKTFNCALKGYVNKGDPCKNVDAYSEGPRFPLEKAKGIHPLIKSIDLAWEHGDLQAVSFTLNEILSEDDVRKQLGLPKVGGELPKNVMSISVQRCGRKASCVVIQGFDHMGAGDVECGGE